MMNNSTGNQQQGQAGRVVFMLLCAAACVGGGGWVSSSWVGAALASLAVGAGFLAGFWQRAASTSPEFESHTAHQADHSLPSHLDLKDFSDLGRLWAPTLSKQLTMANRQMEEGIVELTASFGDIHQQLNQIVQLASEAADVLGHTSDHHGKGLAQGVQETLTGMLGSIRQSLDEKSIVFEELKGFVASTDELAKMATAVENLASKTNLLALNAAIEAARAGENGRGFAIVADEVRKLSMLSAETGLKIRERVNSISVAAKNAGEGAKKMEASDQKMLEEADHVLHEVVARFEQVTVPLQQTSEQIISNTQQTLSGLSNVVVGFQFQDRVSQIIGHVNDSLTLLKGQVENGSSNLNTTQLMHELEKNYTMDEERLHHNHHTAKAKSIPSMKKNQALTSVQRASVSASSVKKVENKAADDDIVFF